MARATYRGRCPSCETERTLIETPPWQNDACTECGTEIPDDASRPGS